MKFKVYCRNKRSINNDVLFDFLQNRAGKKAPRTYNLIGSAICSICSWCNIKLKFSRKPVIENNNFDQIVKDSKLFMDWIKTQGFEKKVMYQLLSETAGRAQDLVGLKVSDIDFDNKIIFLRAQKSLARKTPLSEALLRDLKKYIEEHQLTMSSDLFEFKKSKEVTDSCRTEVKNFNKTNIDGNQINISAHSLRHARISQLAKTKSAKIFILQKIAGHSDPATTSRYIHGLESEIKNVIDEANSA